MGAEVTLIHVIDRDADDYALFARLLQANQRFIIRGNHDRLTRQELRSVHLSQRLLEVPAVACRQIKLSMRQAKLPPGAARRHPARPSREARIEMGATRVTLLRPKSAERSLPPTLTLNCVFVREVDPPPDRQPVDWRLWTAESIETPEDCWQVVDDYRTRWVIEEFILAIKSECAVQERQLESQEALMRLLTVMAPIAWHMLLLRVLARAEPEAPASTILTPGMLEVLERTELRYPLPEHPTAKDALLTIAGMGGFLKHNGMPGFRTLAHGEQKLLALVQGYELGRRVAAEGLPSG
jgi:hypothetical protein